MNFAMYSSHATKVERCLFDSAMRVACQSGFHCPSTPTWCAAYLPDIRPGQLYGDGVYGPRDPSAGHRFNPHTIVADAYATSIGRPVRWDDSMFSCTAGSATADLSVDARDNASYASINFITAHDGFTRHDLVSYDRKHNDANGDNNEDGENTGA